MLKAIFGFLGLLVVLAIGSSLVTDPPDAVRQIWQGGQATTRVHDPSAPQKGDGHKKLVSTGARESRPNTGAQP